MTVNKTSIEWVKNPDGSQGYTWNPITGCLNHTPEGLCLGGNFPCYAYRLANGRLRQRYLANIMGTLHGQERHGGNLAKMLRPLNDPFYPRFWPERLDDLRTWTAEYLMPPRGIFVCDMGELFGDWVPREWQDKIFEAISTCPQHRFYLLTKQPQNLIKFSPFPDNCWVGVTVTKDGIGDSSAGSITCLEDVEAKVKFISFEPLLEPINFGCYTDFVDWVIIGAQTKPAKYPEISWVEEIVRACDKAGVPVFLKDNLWPLFDGSKYAVPLWAFDKESKLRQEMPVETDKA